MDEATGLLTIIAITSTVTFGLVICGLIMQAINYVRISKYEREIKGLINDLRLRK
ncbi:hypothetical protein RDp07_gp36 [Roseobacter phage RD-1410Ws-07]|uniref:Uncharacterized protein n=2 Tax=Sanyabayvirus DS1410Ws06 TaxID=2844087 RepID=A0A191VYQ2_9CAUD|nr:hypothetical protein HYO98_gp39 [Dinoroseobacter phage DS-1410Ws-06]ANJ20696.1 hypothetical protein DSp06_gp39 [Dinoroseobacter phage DS-1410Ws-06]ANJ20847.1 hypothetical protein RDp07_gp36 [Roseobacter phage RD-1410Ws-07]